MELIHAIAARRAVREYTDAAVSRDEIRALIDAAVLAPSARNLQPWSFAVLADRGHVQGYADEAKQWLLDHHAAELGPLATMLERPDYNLFHGAPALVLILATDHSSQSSEDCCLAAQNLLLAARARGFGTCWIGLARPWLNLPDVKAELGLPASHEVVAPIVLGHPRKWPDAHERTPPEIMWLD